jgi:hypothetical protein
MVGLLSEFEDRLPFSPAFIRLRDQERYDEALPMEWILKVQTAIWRASNRNSTDLCIHSIPCSTETGALLARRGNVMLFLVHYVAS